MIDHASAAAKPSGTYERMFEATFESRKTYADPFNDVDVDVIFSKDGVSWRVPAFWHGGQKWTIRFAPPAAGEYRYQLQSTDATNSDLNGVEGRVRITAYSGPNELLRHGTLRVSANKRYFEHADGAPFYWLGDTWWTGLSDRLPWDGFKTLTADRKAKGYTAVQLVVGLVPPEELAPVDPGFNNEGGAVWDARFQRINPAYFDHADRRIEHLIDAGLVPVLVGGWRKVLAEMGIGKMRQHWRYIVARYGAYPVVWMAGGEVYDPAPERLVLDERIKPVPGWTELARYIRSIDPYHHPLSIHELPPPFDAPVQDQSLTDFDAIQAGHFGWNSIETEVALLNARYSRTDITKPLVIAEFGYERLGETHFEDMQRAAFWLAMLNGAAGYTYGAAPTFEANTVDKPYQRGGRFSLRTWEEGMLFPGGQQVGMAARLLKQLEWWKFQPRPDWVTPRGTTLLEPKDRSAGTSLGNWTSYFFSKDPAFTTLDWPTGEWQAKRGSARAPYAAGAESGSRVVYVPSFGLRAHYIPPTVLQLDANLLYDIYLWDPVLGTRLPLGAIQYRQAEVLQSLDSARLRSACQWLAHKGRVAEEPGTSTQEICLPKGLDEQQDTVVSVTAPADEDVDVVLRYRDAGTYVAVKYRAAEDQLFLVERKNGVYGDRSAITATGQLSGNVRITAELRGKAAAASVSDGRTRHTSAIIDIESSESGRIGIIRDARATPNTVALEVMRSRSVAYPSVASPKLYDAAGSYRGQAGSAGWPEFSAGNLLLLDAYRPRALPPLFQDWVLVLDGKASPQVSMQ